MRRRASPHRRRLLAVACAVTLCAAVLGAQSRTLVVERRGDRLHLAAPHFHFLEGRPLEQLHNGAAVPFLFTVTVEGAQGGGRWAHLQDRFVVSYDLWEEKFAVVREGRPQQAVSHLTATAAEAWCLDALLPSIASVPADKSFVVKLQCSVAPEEDPQSGEGLSLSTLIDVFSRRGAPAPPRWELLSPPLRLVDLKDRPRR